MPNPLAQAVTSQRSGGVRGGCCTSTQAGRVNPRRRAIHRLSHAGNGAAAGERAQAELRVFMKYGPRGERVITGIERVSRPGRRVYFGRDDVPEVLAGLGTSILTTSRGVMTGRQAVKAGVGCEVLCNVW